MRNTDSESPCGVPTAELNADMASSILMILVSDSRSSMISTLSMSMNECKMSRRFLRWIVSNTRDKSIPSILITYL